MDDSQFYVEKLAKIIRINKLNSLTVIHMEVPCCFGLTHICSRAIASAGTKLAFEDITVTLQGKIKKTETIEV